MRCFGETFRHDTVTHTELHFSSAASSSTCSSSSSCFSSVLCLSVIPLYHYIPFIPYSFKRRGALTSGELECMIVSKSHTDPGGMGRLADWMTETMWAKVRLLQTLNNTFI